MGGNVVAPALCGRAFEMRQIALGWAPSQRDAYLEVMMSE
jgi:hypothetical protein